MRLLRFFSSYSVPIPAEVRLTRLTGVDSGTAILHLCRPSSRNALGRVMLSQLTAALDEVRHSGSAIRALVLASDVPGVFCAGADLKERASMSKVETALFVQGLGAAFSGVAALPVPTVAALDGVALGGGLELALACDFRVASQATTLGLPETTLAIIPGAGGTQRLPRLIGPARAKELIFTGRRVSGEEALAMGLVCRAVPPGQAMEGALAFIRAVLSGGPVAMRAAKEAINGGLEVDLATGLILEAASYSRVIGTSDRLEGLAAFKEKRPPVYRGE